MPAGKVSLDSAAPRMSLQLLRSGPGPIQGDGERNVGRVLRIANEWRGFRRYVRYPAYFIVSGDEVEHP